MAEVDLILGVIYQRPERTVLNRRTRVQPSCIGAETDWVEMLRPDLDILDRGGDCR
jgi:hypothetical protein